MFGTKKLTLTIDGMMCMHCVAHVKNALSALDGVKGVDVDLASKKATIKVVKDFPIDTVEKAISDAGYKLVEVNE